MTSAERSYTIASDLDALGQLFRANQELAACELRLEQARSARNEQRDYRDTLLVRIGTYTMDREAEVNKQSLFDEEFKKNPRPTWFDGTTGGPGGAEGPQAPA